MRLVEAWPREARADRKRFEKLKEGYVKARYSKHSRISEDELDWLGDRVSALAAVAEALYSERIAELERNARAASGATGTNPISHSDRRTVIDLSFFVPYIGTNRTHPASVRKDMHTGWVFYFGTACSTMSGV